MCLAHPTHSTWRSRAGFKKSRVRARRGFLTQTCLSENQRGWAWGRSPPPARLSGFKAVCFPPGCPRRITAAMATVSLGAQLTELLTLTLLRDVGWLAG